MTSDPQQRRREGSRRAQASRQRRAVTEQRKQKNKIIYAIIGALAIGGIAVAVIWFGLIKSDPAPVGFEVPLLPGLHNPPYLHSRYLGRRTASEDSPHVGEPLRSPERLGFPRSTFGSGASGPQHGARRDRRLVSTREPATSGVGKSTARRNRRSVHGCGVVHRHVISRCCHGMGACYAPRVIRPGRNLGVHRRLSRQDWPRGSSVPTAILGRSCQDPYGDIPCVRKAS